MSEGTDKLKLKASAKSSKLDQATILENINERQDELDFEKTKMAEYVKTKKAAKELKHQKQVKAQTDRQLAKAVKELEAFKTKEATKKEAPKIIPVHHAEVKKHHVV